MVSVHACTCAISRDVLVDIFGLGEYMVSNGTYSGYYVRGVDQIKDDFTTFIFWPDSGDICNVLTYIRCFCDHPIQFYTVSEHPILVEAISKLWYRTALSLTNDSLKSGVVVDSKGVYGWKISPFPMLDKPDYIVEPSISVCSSNDPWAYFTISNKYPFIWQRGTELQSRFEESIKCCHTEDCIECLREWFDFLGLILQCWITII